ncbi:hypothetical protein C5S29_10020 [ANME-1 cluster archaeon GoMg3.2]|nr:hypothetical protein [ANME-1 cluster archaeon GoMg3.2]
MERAEEKLGAANLLFENDMFADAISEAYYAMFHAAKSLLALRDIYPRTHAGVVSQFGLQFVNGGLIEELYAKSLAKAQTRREKADYDIYYEPSKEEAESIVEDAEMFLERIKKAVGEMQKSRI